MRLIDADLLINCIRKSLDKEMLKGTIREKGFEVYALTKFIEIVDAVPTEDPVKHGKWEIKLDDYDSEYMMCSCCGAEFYDGDYGTVDIQHNYCPNCGARMDGE